MSLSVDQYIRIKDGSVRFRFNFTDSSGKRCRLKASQTPYFATKPEAEAWAKTQDAYNESMKARVAKRLEWQTRYLDFQAHIEKFVEWHKQDAPNSFQGAKYHLEQFIFPFFLGKKEANNPNLWHLHQQDFLDHLRKDIEKSKGKKGNLSFATKNHIIRTYNNFIRYLFKYKLLDKENRLFCEGFKQSLLNKRGYEAVIPEDEFIRVHRKLCEINQTVADFYYVLYKTGMRFNELFSLPMNHLYGGLLTGPLAEEMQRHGISHYGYIVLESQIASKTRKREPDGSFIRKPLKSKKKIEAKTFRTIPIMDRECWNILARRFKVNAAEQEKATYGSDKINYLLFDDLELNIASRTLRAAYEALKLPAKAYHCCRHSFVTFLVGKTRSYFLTKSISGHKSNVFDDYVHIYELIAMKASQSEHEIEVID